MDDKEKSKEQLESELTELRQRTAEMDRRHQISAEIIAAFNIDQSAEEAIGQVGAILRQSIPYERLMIRLREVGWRYRLEDGHFYFDKDEVDRSASKYMKNPNYSAIGWVFLHKQPLLRGDISKERRFESDRRLIEKGVISQLIIPVVVNNEVIGLFNFHSRKANCFDRGHLELAQPVVNTIALTVKQFQTRQEMEAIHEITTAIQESLKLDEILKKILEHIRLQGYDRVRIYLYDEMQKELIGALQVGSLHYRGFEGVRLPIEEDVYSSTV